MKAVGLFVVGWIGVQTVLDLWNILTHKKTGLGVFVFHFLARALCLILVPISIYVATFYVHFEAVNQTGVGDGMMSTEFQKTLIGSAFRVNSTDEVGIGSQISLNHMNTNPCMLRSHIQTYPAGSRHQQTLCGKIDDQSSKWIIRPESTPPDTSQPLFRFRLCFFSGSSLMSVFLFPEAPYYPVTNGTIVRLLHTETLCYLRVTDNLAHVATENKEVCCLKQYGEYDEENKWQVIIVKQRKSKL